MGTKLKRLATAGLVGATVLGGTLVGGSLLADAGVREEFNGRFKETSAGAALGYKIRGTAQMTVESNETEVKVTITGLNIGLTYGSHLHNGTCADGGGVHYQDVEGGDITPPNELWLSTTKDPLAGITPDRSTNVDAEGSSLWAARTDSETMKNARSIIVHAPGGTRIACADLT